MKLMLRVLLSLLLLPALLTFDIARVAACSCVVDVPFITRVTDTDAIFTGKVMASAEGASGIPIMVTKSWKGVNQPTVTIAVGNSSCSFFFETDKEYLIFATEVGSQLRTGLCNGNQPLETAGKTVVLLDTLLPPSPLLALHPAATITVHGENTYLGETDQLSVRFVRDDDSVVEVYQEQQRTQLQDTLRVNKVPASLLDSLYSDGRDFYLTFTREQFTDDELALLLEQLTKNEAKIIQESQLPLRRIEVMAGLSDCTLPVASAQRNALWDAKARADLLAGLVGGRTDSIVAVMEERVNGALRGSYVCDVLRWRQWHELPLATDLSAMMQITVPVSVQVTFGVKPLITGESLQQEGFVPATATPAVLSPLATPRS